MSFRNGRWHLIIKADPRRISDKYCDAVSKTVCLQSHYNTREEAVHHVEAYFQHYREILNVPY